MRAIELLHGGAMVVAARAVRVTVMVVLVAVVMVMMGVPAALVAVFCCWGVLLAAATAGSRLLHFGRLLCWCAVRVIAVTVIVVMWLLGAAA